MTGLRQTCHLSFSRARKIAEERERSKGPVMKEKDANSIQHETVHVFSSNILAKSSSQASGELTFYIDGRIHLTTKPLSTEWW